MLFKAILGFLLLKMTNLLLNLRWFPVLTLRDQPPGRPEPLPPASLLVPVRDETATLRQLLPSLLDQAGVSEVLVLDDQSSDGSDAVLAELLAPYPHARLIMGSAPPAGWVGKTWACHQLALASSGAVLAFCDADVELAAGAIAAVRAEMRDQRADVFSVFPRQRTGSLGERLTVGLIDDVLLCLLPFRLLQAPVPAAATANGSLLVFTRAAYDQVGGFAAVRDQIVEDVALARRARGAGLTLGLALGGGLVQTRMYDSYPQVVRGLGRGVRPVLGRSRVWLAVVTLWHVAAYTWPVVRAVRRPSWLVLVGLGLLERLLVALKTDPRRAGDALLTPLCPLAFVPIAVQASRRTQHWKGRVYSQ